jgi:hypothetical protein
MTETQTQIEEVLKKYNEKYGINKPQEPRTSPKYELCENDNGSLNSVDCGFCPVCLSKVPLENLVEELHRRLKGGLTLLTRNPLPKYKE